MTAKQPPWTSVAEEQLLRLHAAGADPAEIARKMDRPVSAVGVKLRWLKAEGRVKEESRQARGTGQERTIVDQAKYWLRYDGLTERQVSMMCLDDIMLQANIRLKRWGMRQLGAKREWLVRDE